MILAGMLGIDALASIEPSFASLADPGVADLFLSLPADAAKLVIDEDEEPLALAVHTPDGWWATHFVFRPATIGLIGLAEELDAEIYQEARSDWTAGLREYYSRVLQADVAPAVEDTRPGRDAEIRDLVGEVWNDHAGRTCIDGCCGSGIASDVLRQLGYRTLAFDNDPALLSLGLARGRLLPEDTLWIDGTEASVFCPPADRAVGLMLGDIQPFTAGIWEAIVGELLALSEETLFSAATEPEIRMIGAWCSARGRNTRIFEHERDLIYDRWVCVATRE